MSGLKYTPGFLRMSFDKFLEKHIYSNYQKCYFSWHYCSVWCSFWKLSACKLVYFIIINSWIKTQCLSKVSWEYGICSFFTFYFMNFFVQYILFSIFCSKMGKVGPIQSHISQKVARDHPFFLAPSESLWHFALKAFLTMFSIYV